MGSLANKDPVLCAAMMAFKSLELTQFCRNPVKKKDIFNVLEVFQLKSGKSCKDI